MFLFKCLKISRMLEKRSLSYNDGPIPVPLDDPFLVENVERIRVCDTGMFSFLFKFNGFVGSGESDIPWFCIEKVKPCSGEVFLFFASSNA